MNFDILIASICASNDSNAIILDCRYECQPSWPRPSALQRTAKLYEDSMNLMPRVFSMYSSITASRNQIIVSTASVWLHSSNVKQFIDARLHTNDSSKDDGRQISEQRFDAQTFIPLSLRTCGRLLFTVSEKNK